MAKQQNDPIMSTYARLTLSNWHVLATIIQHYVQESGNEQTEQLGEFTLSPEQIEEALRGPLQEFIRNMMSAYATLANVRMALTIDSDDTFKEHLTAKNREIDFDKNPLDQFDQEKLSDIQDKLDELTESQANAWQEHFANWSADLAKKLNESGLELSILEMAELQTYQPLCEVNRRFTELNIELPKTKKTEMNFSKYLTLRADIMIHSALGRQHQPHQQSDINKFLKYLKKTFEEINTMEKRLLKEQKMEVNTVIQPISFARINK